MTNPFAPSCRCQTIATRVWGPPSLTVCLALGRLGENTVVIMARGRGSRSLSVCVASTGPPWVRQYHEGQAPLHRRSHQALCRSIQNKIKCSICSYQLNAVSSATLDQTPGYYTSIER